MTERDWLVSTDPAAMLRLITENPDHVNIDCIRSYRKLRLFEQARWWGGFLRTGRDQAALIRCVFGNPFRVAVLPRAEHRRFDGIEVRSTPILSRHAYETPAVLALARAADAGDASALGPLADALLEAGCPAEETCPGCRGSSVVRKPAPARHFLDHPADSHRDCPDCRGSGRVPSPLLAHLRQPAEVVCPECGGNGGIDYAGPRERKQMLDCPACRGTGCLAQPHALPGCWAISLLLNKE